MLSSNHWDIFSFAEWLLFVLWSEVTVAIYCLEHALSIDTIFAITLFSLAHEVFFQSSNNELEAADPENVMIMEVGGVVSSRRTETNFSLGRFHLRLLDNGNLVLNSMNSPTKFAYDDYYRSGTSDASNSSNSGYRLIFNESGYMYILRRNGLREDLTKTALPTTGFYRNSCWKKKLPLSNGKVDSGFNGKTFIKFKKGDIPPGNPGLQIPETKTERDIKVITGIVLLIMEVGGVVSSRRTETNFSLGRFQLRLLDNGNLVLNYMNLPTKFVYDDYYTSETYDASNSSNSGYRLIFNESGYMYILRRNGLYGSCIPDFELSCRDDGLNSTEDQYDFVELINVDWPTSDYERDGCWKKKLPLSNGRFDIGMNGKAFLKFPKGYVPPDRPPPQLPGEKKKPDIKFIAGSVVLDIPMEVQRAVTLLAE
ncbi:hypothetical protein D5086_007667 [Populus alba]|uniref:Uncharacterized protein n=1 Tax=Populus alba TaxID=43335 RepID=A0ACC4CP91_POPAL